MAYVIENTSEHQMGIGTHQWILVYANPSSLPDPSTIPRRKELGVILGEGLGKHG